MPRMHHGVPSADASIMPLLAHRSVSPSFFGSYHLLHLPLCDGTPLRVPTINIPNEIKRNQNCCNGVLCSSNHLGATWKVRPSPYICYALCIMLYALCPTHHAHILDEFRNLAVVLLPPPPLALYVWSLCRPTHMLVACHGIAICMTPHAASSSSHIIVIQSVSFFLVF